MKKVSEIYLKYKQIIWPMTIGLLSLLLIVFVIVPQIRLFLETRGKISETTSRLQNLNSKIQQLQNVDSSNLKDGVAVALNSLPEGQEPSSAFGVIQKIAASSGVNLTTLGFSPAKSSLVPGASSYAVRAQVLATKETLAIFLKNLTQSSVSMSISGFQISSSEKADTLDASLQIDIFYAPSPKSIGAIDAPLVDLTPDERQIIASLQRPIAAIATSSAVTTSGPSILVPRGKPDPFH